MRVETADMEVLAVSGKFNSLVIAKNLAMDISLFNKYNPNFDMMLSSNGNYDMRLPSDKMSIFVSSKYQILNECVQLMLGDDVIVTPIKTSPKKIKPEKKKA